MSFLPPLPFIAMSVGSYVVGGRCVSSLALVVGDPAGGPMQPAWEGFVADGGPCAGARQTQPRSNGFDGADPDGGANPVETWDSKTFAVPVEVRAIKASDTLFNCAANDFRS